MQIGAIRLITKRVYTNHALKRYARNAQEGTPRNKKCDEQDNILIQTHICRVREYSRGKEVEWGPHHIKGLKNPQSSMLCVHTHTFSATLYFTIKSRCDNITRSALPEMIKLDSGDVCFGFLGRRGTNFTYGIYTQRWLFLLFLELFPILIEAQALLCYEK